MQHADMLLEVREDSGKWQGIAPSLGKGLGEGVRHIFGVALEALPATVLATTPATVPAESVPQQQSRRGVCDARADIVAGCAGVEEYVSAAKRDAIRELPSMDHTRPGRSCNDLMRQPLLVPHSLDPDTGFEQYAHISSMMLPPGTTAMSLYVTPSTINDYFHNGPQLCSIVDNYTEPFHNRNLVVPKNPQNFPGNLFQHSSPDAQSKGPQDCDNVQNHVEPSLPKTEKVQRSAPICALAQLGAPGPPNRHYFEDLIQTMTTGSLEAQSKGPQDFDDVENKPSLPKPGFGRVNQVSEEVSYSAAWIQRFGQRYAEAQDLTVVPAMNEFSQTDIFFDSSFTAGITDIADCNTPSSMRERALVPPSPAVDLDAEAGAAEAPLLTSTSNGCIPSMPVNPIPVVQAWKSPGQFYTPISFLAPERVTPEKADAKTMLPISSSYPSPVMSRSCMGSNPNFAIRFTP